MQSTLGLRAESQLQLLAGCLACGGSSAEQMLFEVERDLAATWNCYWDIFLATIMYTQALFIGPAVLLSLAPALHGHESDLPKT